MSRTKYWYLIALVVLAVPLIVPFLAGGLPNTADAEIHLHRIVSAATDIENGYLWPRWTPYLHQDYGYPIHNFYAPGLHILGAIAYLLTHIDPVILLKLLQAGITVLYPIGAYRFARTFTGRAGALVAAAAYLYAPFRFHELWIQSNLSQFAAMALLPGALWAIARGAERPGKLRAAIIGLLFAAVVLIHHPTAFLFAPFAGLFALLDSLLRFRRDHPRPALHAAMTTIGGMIFGLALSAIFWLPALLELRYTQVNAIQTGMFSIAENTVPLRDLLSGAVPIDRALVAMPPQLMIGLPQWIAALLGLLVLRERSIDRRAKAIVIAGAATTFLCAFMITPASAPLWEHLPIANLVVYPWRLLGVIGVTVLPGAAILPSLLPNRWRSACAGVLIGVFFVAALPLLYAPLTFQTPSAPTPQGEVLYEQRTGNVGLTSAEEYLPRWAMQRPLDATKRDSDVRQWSVALAPLPDGLTAQPAACSAGASCYTVTSQSATLLTFHQMYFPGWQASINGQIVDPQPTGVYGLIGVSIPAGESQIRLWYGGTTVQHLATVISLFAAALAILILLSSLMSRRRTTVDSLPPGSLALPRSISFALIAFIVLNQTVLLPSTDVFRPHSDPASPPASHTLRVRFGDTIELIGYDIDSTSAAPGDTVRVRLYWHLLKPTTLSLRASVQVVSLDGQQTWGDHNSINLGGYGSDTLVTDRYVVDLHPVKLAADAPSYVGQVQVTLFWVDGQTLHYLSTDQGKNEALLTSFRIMGPNPPSRPSLTATTLKLGDSVALLGYEWSTSAGKTCILLRWQALRDSLDEEAVMLHILSTDGQMLAAADSAPVNGLYPTSSWQNRQIVDDQHCFTLPKGATQLAIGMYSRRDQGRLPAMQSGTRLQDDQFVVEIP